MSQRPIATELTSGVGRPRWKVESEHDGWRITSEWIVLGVRPEPTSLTLEPVEPKPIAAHAVRALPLGAILSEGRVALQRTALVKAAALEQIAGRPKKAAQLNAWSQAHSSRRGRVLGDDALREVARVYEEAWRADRPVNTAVRDAFFLSQSGAAKRIMAARRAGLLEGMGPKR